ncbi:DUF5715 family protein [Conexibacter sp. CPCC 206217]|uniref:DUF5715 family protein n=1 Tax=Conexibacter sp. CPCC 206217 TaxID=3064574 RepID=UPI002715A397|nr:DUF5715 family protein [Conexibacter sp. CPCC 206217]MDO8211347.1 DUF5715 family protein [Conexibacter sp. CPCC 206217]
MSSTRRPPSSSSAASRLRLALVAVIALGAIAFVLTQRGGDGAGERADGGRAAPPPSTDSAPASRRDPFAFDPSRAQLFEQRAAFGSAHPLYAMSPGGAPATAARVVQLRPLIEAATRGSDVDPATLEAIVVLESAGRPDAIAGTDLAGAVGLTQILAETGTSLLGMHVDVAASTRLSRRLGRALARGDRRDAARLEARRRRVDERFDPRKALTATVRYLTIARERLGRDDLAVVSYHMGIGNLEQAIAAFGHRAGTPNPSYTELFFASSPTSHAAAWRVLSGFGDESSLYYWKIQAARDLMALQRSDPRALRQLSALQTAKASSENVLHPPGAGEAFADGDALRAAYADGTLERLPRNAAQLGLRIDPQMGELAPRLHEPKALYRGLRPDALRLLVELAAGTRRISGVAAPLTITSTVRSERYQERLARSNIEATHAFSIHTTGWTFDILRRYANGDQAQALQFMLDRLQLLGAITWVREPAAIHVTVAGDVDRFLGR